MGRPGRRRRAGGACGRGGPGEIRLGGAAGPGAWPARTRGLGARPACAAVRTAVAAGTRPGLAMDGADIRFRGAVFFFLQRKRGRDKYNVVGCIAKC